MGQAQAWPRLRLSVDPASHEIIAHELTDDNTSDAAMIGDLGANSGGNIRAVIADGAHDGAPVRLAIRAARPGLAPPRIGIPPGRASIRDRREPHGGPERERHAVQIAVTGRMAWQKCHGYGERSLVKKAIFRIKRIIGGRLTSRTFGARESELAIPITIANRNRSLARPVFLQGRAKAHPVKLLQSLPRPIASMHQGHNGPVNA